MTVADLLAAEADHRLEALEALAPSATADLAADRGAAAFGVRELLLGDDDANVRAAAAEWLGHARAKLVAGALVDALYDTHPSVRAAACGALARLRFRDAGPLLSRLALEEPIWWARRAAVLAVARLLGRDALPTLRAVLDDPFWRVRHAAVRALLALGAADASDPALRDAMVAPRGNDSERAAGALRYLARRLGVMAPSGEPLQEPVPEWQSQSLGEGAVYDPDPAVIAARLERGQATSAGELALYLGDPHEALRDVAAQRIRAASDVRLVSAATLWLEEPRIPHATASVVALLDSLGPEIEELLDAAFANAEARPGAAAWALSYVANAGRWDRREEILALLDACPPRPPVVRRAAVAALGTWLVTREGTIEERRDGIVRLIAALADRDEDVHRIAAHGLVGAREPAAWQAVAKLDFARSPILVQRLIGASAREVNDLGTLMTAAHAADPATRARAIAALRHAGKLDPATLREARADVDPWIRSAVLDAEGAIEVLERDADPTVRRAAFVEASRGGFVLEAARIAALADDPWLRANAAERLARSPHDEDLVLVLRLSRDVDVAVRAAAADVVDIAKDLPARLSRIRATVGEHDEAVRLAVDTWSGARAEQLMADARALVFRASPAGEAPAATPVTSPRNPRRTSFAANARALGRTEIMVPPLVLSGANEPSIASLFRALNAGCNAFFWEPRYRSLTTFLRAAASRGERPVIVAGTYHASERAIRADVERALRRLNRDRLDVFLVFWTRSAARLEGEVPRTLRLLQREGLLGAVGFSTHDRSLAREALARAPWDVVMIRHSAAHPGAEDGLLARAAAAGTGVLSFSATSYGRMLRSVSSSSNEHVRENGAAVALPTATECYRYSLDQPGVTACVSAPRGGRELIENLAVLDSSPLEASRLRALRDHGRLVREESLDFGRHIRRFPALPPQLEEPELDALDGVDEETIGAPHEG